MKIIKKTSVYWGAEVKDVVLSYGGGSFVKFIYSANQDLFIYAHGDNKKNNEGKYVLNFKIDKRDDVFSVFEEFFNSIVESKVYNSEDTPNADRLNAMIKNNGAYHELVKNEEVHFYSDNTYNEKANILHISKDDEGINLEFIDNPEDAGSLAFVVRVSNDGSKYAPFNRCFMRLLDNLQGFGEDVME